MADQKLSPHPRTRNEQCSLHLDFINTVDGVISDLAVLQYAAMSIIQEPNCSETCNRATALLSMMSDHISMLTAAQDARDARNALDVAKGGAS